MKIKNQNDRTVSKALEILRQIKLGRELKQKAAEQAVSASQLKSTGKPNKPKDLPKNGFVPPQYPAAPKYMREIPHHLR